MKTSLLFRFRVFVKRWALPFAVGWTLLILGVLFLPGEYVPSTGLDFDKVAHFLLFAGFSGLWMIALSEVLPRTAVYVVVLGLAYAVLTEVVQSLASISRQGDPMDAAANILGVLWGTAAYLIWKHFLRPEDD